MLHANDPTLQIHTLPNGLTVYFKPNAHPKKRVALELLVQVGAQDEAPEFNGISHFIEHMAFNTTKHFAQGQVFQEMKAAGVSQGHHANAYTGFGRTVYHFYVPNTPELLEKSCLFLAEFAFHQAFLPEEVEKERQVILEELRRAQDKDYAYYTGMLGHVFPPESPMGRNTVLGTEENLRSFTSELLAQFYHTHYVPSNMVLMVVGDCTYEDIAPFIDTHFGTIQATKPPKHSPVAPMTRTAPEVYIHRHKEYTETYAGIIFPHREIPNVTTEDRRRLFAYVLLQWIYQDRFQDLVQEYPKITSIGVNKDTVNFLPSSLLFAYVYTQSGYLKQGYTKLLQHIHEMNIHGPTPEELLHVQNKAREYIATSLKEVHKTAHSTHIRSLQQAHLGHFTYVAPEVDLAFFAEHLETITCEDIRAVSAWLFPLAQFPLLTFTLPSKDTSSASEFSDTFLKILASTPPKKSTQAQEALAFPLPSAEYASITSTEEIADAHLYTLSNGLRVFVKHTDFEADTIYCVLNSFGDHLYETPETIGLDDAYISSLLRGGTTQYSFRTIQRYLSPKKIHLTIDKWNAIGLQYSLTAAPHTFVEGIQIMVHQLLFPAFRPDDCRASINDLVQQLRQYETTKEFAAELHLSQLQYGTHPVGYTTRSKDLRARTLEQVNAYHTHAFPTEQSVLTIVGNLTNIDIPSLLVTTFGALPRTSAPTSEISETYHFPTTSAQKTVRKSEEPKALVRIAFPGPRTDAPYYSAFSLYVDMLTELLEHKIREELGGTYSIYAANGASSYLAEGYMEIAFECDPARAKLLEEETRKVCQQAPTLITSEHHTRALEPINSWFEELQEDNDLWLRAGKYLCFGRSPLWLREEMERLQRVTLPDILEVAKRYADPTIPSVRVKVLPYT